MDKTTNQTYEQPNAQGEVFSTFSMFNADRFVPYYAIPGSELLLTRNRVFQDFTITTDSYILLCTHLYEVLCAGNARFAERVSESAFQYYAVMLLWQRLAQFLSSESRRSSPFLDKLSSFEPCLKGIPKPLEIYLEGIGNFKHPNVGEMRFRLPKILFGERFNLTTGMFGKVTADTHFLYEAFPAPGIAALRILNDVAENYNYDPDWDLPKDLRPDSNEYSTAEDRANSTPCRPIPTRNLLGWARAQRLTSKQSELFKASGIESNVPVNDLPEFFKNSHKLLAEISAYFDGTKKPPILFSHPFSNSTVLNPPTVFGSSKNSSVQNPPSGFRFTSNSSSSLSPEGQSDYFTCASWFTKVKRSSFDGSTIQGLVVERADTPSGFDRYKMYCDGKVSVHSSWECNNVLATGAVIAGYRMLKEPIKNKHSWSCYDFNEYERVPESWVETRNSIYMFDCIEGINIRMWSTGTTAKTLTQYEFLKKHLLGSAYMLNSYM